MSDKQYKCSHPSCKEQFNYLQLKDGKTPIHKRTKMVPSFGGKRPASVNCNWSGRSAIKLS